MQVYDDGDDEVIPAPENAERMKSAWLAASTPYREIVKPGRRHHLHGVETRRRSPIFWKHLRENKTLVLRREKVFTVRPATAVFGSR